MTEKTVEQHVKETREAAGVEERIAPSGIENGGVDVGRMVSAMAQEALKQTTDAGELPEGQLKKRHDLVWSSAYTTSNPEPNWYKVTTIGMSPLGDTLSGYGLTPKIAAKHLYQRYREDLIKAKVVSGGAEASNIVAQCEFWPLILP